jgi:hypothetical protein
MKILSNAEAILMGYSKDKRKRRRQHRVNARDLFDQGGSILTSVGLWNLMQARRLGR